MGINPQAHSQSICTELEETQSPKENVSIKSLPLGLREPYRRGGRRSVRAKWDGVHQENKGLVNSSESKDIWAYRNWSSVHGFCTGLHQMGS